MHVLRGGGGQLVNHVANGESWPVFLLSRRAIYFAKFLGKNAAFKDTELYKMDKMLQRKTGSKRTTSGNKVETVNKRTKKGEVSQAPSSNASKKCKEDVKTTDETPKKRARTSGDEHKTKPDSKTTTSVKKNEKGQLIFKDFPEFKPNMTPKEVLQAGSFGGTYFRPIYSSITKQNYNDVWDELPGDWLEGLNIEEQVASATYRQDVNTYKVKCGGSLEMWESSGWIVAQDPYGWFQWFCRFYQGRRTEDDQRQISRWAKCAGLKGRWRNNLITKIVRSGCGHDNPTVSPVVRQTLQHWAYRLTAEDYREGAKRVKAK